MLCTIAMTIPWQSCVCAISFVWHRLFVYEPLMPPRPEFTEETPEEWKALCVSVRFITISAAAAAFAELTCSFARAYRAIVLE